MPELPEVETIRRDLSIKIIGRKIISLEIRDRKLGEAKSFARVLVGDKIMAVERIGKLLILKLKSGKFLLIHLKMTGQLVYQKGGEKIYGGHEIIKSPLKRGVPPAGGRSPRDRGVFVEINERQTTPSHPPQSPLGQGGSSLERRGVGGKLPGKHTRFILNFSGGRKLFFNDLRRFGYVKIADKKQLAEIKSAYGLEPLKPEFTLTNLGIILANKKINIKAALMDQKNIAGIGNIYGSEILFAAGVKPTRPAGSLTDKEIAKIFQATKAVLRNAIKHRGTTFSDYVDAGGRQGNFSKLLKVYERAGEKCSICGSRVKTMKIAGRSTFYCPKCQK